MLKLYADKGWQPIVAPEMEFTSPSAVKTRTSAAAAGGRSGRPETGRQSFSIEAANEFDPLFEDVYDWCELQQLDLDTLIHEDGTAQMEINFRHGDALADQILVFKRTMREAALKHNVAAFMAKPMTGEPAVPCTCTRAWSTWPRANIFSNADGSMSELFLHHIGGLRSSSPRRCAVRPNVNSFRRFLPDTSAPVSMEWGEETAPSVCVYRMPARRAAGSRTACRALTPTYLAIAASLLCGYIGMVEGIEANAPVQGPWLRTAQPAPAADHRRCPGAHGKAARWCSTWARNSLPAMSPPSAPSTELQACNQLLGA